MGEMNNVGTYTNELKKHIECLKAENADLRQRLQDLTNITRCKDCKYSVVFKGRLLCAHDAKILQSGEICGATAKEENNFCMYGQRD